MQSHGRLAIAAFVLLPGTMLELHALGGRMTDTIERAGLQVHAALAELLEREVLPVLGRDTDAFWRGFAELLAGLAPRNRALLVKRQDLQAKIDAWHQERRGQPHDPEAYRAFLEAIGYLVPEPAPFGIATANVDPEIATMAGPQLVVPVLNARFLLNAANARWGSLYDAFYGTDALDAPPAKPAGTIRSAVRQWSRGCGRSSTRRFRWRRGAGAT